MNAKTRILQQLTDEAQAVAKTTTIDLDAFLACDGDERARRWRQFDRSAKWQLVARMIERLGRDWSEAEIEHWIAKYDAKYALPPVEAAIEGALERLGEQHQRSAETAENAETRRFFRRWAGAFRKALLAYRDGVRPDRLNSGAWLVPSATRAIVHQVSKDGGCSCEAGASGCWHAALVAGVEVGYDDLDTFNAGDAETVEIESVSLGQRLALARRVYLEAA